MKIFYYFVLKNYRGLFRKKFVGNTHLFLIPRAGDDYLYLALLGNIVDEDNSYACVLISRIPDDLLDEIINGEHKHFGERFELIDEIKVNTINENKGEYEIKVLSKSQHILSDLEMIYNEDLSSNSKRIYIIKGKLNLSTEDVGLDSTLRIDAYKKLALVSNKNRKV
jgi:hypothetical protein